MEQRALAGRGNAVIPPERDPSCPATKEPAKLKLRKVAESYRSRSGAWREGYAARGTRRSRDPTGAIHAPVRGSSSCRSIFPARFSASATTSPVRAPRRAPMIAVSGLCPPPLASSPDFKAFTSTSRRVRLLSGGSNRRRLSHLTRRRRVLGAGSGSGILPS
jgi:hypothetical protein